MSYHKPKGTAMHYCKFCNTWLPNDKFNIAKHESGGRHKANEDKYMRENRIQRSLTEKAAAEEAREMERINAEASQRHTELDGGPAGGATTGSLVDQLIAERRQVRDASKPAVNVLKSKERIAQRHTDASHEAAVAKWHATRADSEAARRTREHGAAAAEPVAAAAAATTTTTTTPPPADTTALDALDSWAVADDTSAALDTGEAWRAAQAEARASQRAAAAESRGAAAVAVASGSLGAEKTVGSLRSFFGEEAFAAGAAGPPPPAGALAGGTAFKKRRRVEDGDEAAAPAKRVRLNTEVE